MAIELPRPQLPAKAAQLFEPARLVVADWCSPKSFRVESGLAWLIERAALGNSDKSFWWIGPDFGACAAAMALLRKALTPGSYTISGRAQAMVLLNGASVHFRPADNPNLLHSDIVHALVVDQAIHIPERSWLALRDTSATTGAPVRIISTVEDNSGWFASLTKRVQAGEAPGAAYFCFSALDALEEGILSQSDIDYARGTLPDHVFRALYLCQPYDARVEAAHVASDTRLMTDEELALVAGIDPNSLASLSDEALRHISDDSAVRYH